MSVDPKSFTLCSQSTYQCERNFAYNRALSIDHLRSKSRDRAAINRVLCDKIYVNKSDTLFVFRNTEIYSGGDDALKRDGFYWLEYVSSKSGLPIRFEYYYEGEKEPRKVLKSKFLYR
jgi:hypothetical protein